MSGNAETDAPKIRAFISYSRKDLAFADRLEAALKTRGVESFIDRAEIEKLEDWWLRIEQLIEQADAVVFVLSPHSAASEICAREVEFAARLNKRLAPVLIEEPGTVAPPAEIARLNYVFCRPEDDFDAALGELVAALATDIAWVREHTRIGELARRWQARERSNALVLRGGELGAAERWIAAKPQTAPALTAAQQEFVASSRVAATRRQRIWLGGALGVALLAGMLAVWAEANRRIAVEQRLRVERILEKTTEATKDLVVNVADRYAPQRGIPRAMIVDILKQARRLVEELNSVGESRPELLRNGGLALTELSDALRAQGDRTAALDTAQAAVDVFARLRSTEPHEPSWRAGLIVGYDRLGDAHFDAGDTEQALAAYTQGQGLVAAIDDAGARSRFEAVGRENLGAIRFQAGDLEGALEHFRASLRLRLEGLANEGDSIVRQRSVAVAHEKIGDILLAGGHLDEAKSAYRKSLEITAKLAAVDERNTGWQQDLATSYHKLGDVLMALDAPSEALEFYRKDLAISKALHASDPDWREWRETLLISYERAGNATYMTGDRAAAIDFFSAALDHAKAIAARDRSRRDWLANVSKLFQSVCLLLLAEGEASEAVSRSKEAVEIVRASLATGHEVGDILAELLNNVAWFSLFDNAFDQALVSSQAALAEDPDVKLYRPNRAHALMFLDRTEEARAAYLTHAGERLTAQTTWAEAIRSDFEALRAAGLEHPLMADVERQLDEKTNAAP